MPAGTEQVGINMMVQPSLDPQAAAKVLKDVAALHKKLATLKVDWSAISKQSGLSTKELQKLSKQVSDFTKGLSDATKTSTTSLVKLSSELKKAQEEASDLKAEYAISKDSGAKKKLAGDIASTNKTITELNKQLSDYKKNSSKYNDEVKSLTRSQKNYRTQLEQAAKYSPKDMIKDILGNIGKGVTGGPKAIGPALSGAAGAVGKGAMGGVARTELDSGRVIAESMGGITKAALGLSMAVGALGAFWQLLKAASEHQTKLNKALLEGTGFANDFMASSKNYRKVIDEIRGAAIDASGSLLKFGVNSEQSMKLLSIYTKDATGSLEKTREAVIDMGGGDLTKGVETFARNATVYGKALGIEATDVASTMGKFQSEVGYGAGQVQDLMGNIVKSAATANMPMTKFMNIFKSVIPDVELYQNRIEELTGAITLLSKTMSPKDVQKFMDAFSKGFKGMDFKQRLKTVLVAGTGTVSKALESDFNMKAKTMAKNFKKYGVSGDDFTKAMKGGEGSMAKLMSEAQANAAKKGATISGTEIGNAMKLASYEGARKKGGALNLATATRGAGTFATYKILKDMSQRLTKGFDGLSDHVIHQLGISDDQYEMLRTTHQSMEVYQSQLQQFGKTTSKSFNKGLREAIATRKGIKQQDVSTKDMQNATEEDLFAASENANAQKDYQRTAEDLTTEQVTATTSISDKIDNVIGFLLEKIYNVLQPMLDALDNLWSMFSGATSIEDLFTGSSAKTIKAINQWNKGVQSSGYSGDAKAQMGMVADAIKGAVGSGLKGKDLAESVSSSPAFEHLADLDPKKIEDIAKKQGETTENAMIKAEHFKAAAAKGDKKWMADIIGSLPDASSAMMEAGQDLLKFGTSQEAQAKSATTRPGSATSKIFKTASERQAAEQLSNANQDLETDMTKLSDATKSASEAQQQSAAGAATGGAPIPPGAPASAASPAGAAKITTEATSDQTDELSKGQALISDVQQETADHVYDGINDVAGILKKGIKFERSWMTSQYKNFLKETTVQAFGQALLEFAILNAKMQDDEGFKKAVLDGSDKLVDANTDIADLARIQDKDGDDRAKQITKIVDGIPSRQMGGPIGEAGLYNLHKGEYVVPAGGPERRGGGGGNIVVNLTVHGPNMTPQQFKSAVVGAMDEVARRH